MPVPELLTLAEIARRTGINYRTLLRYLKVHLHRIPHQGEGHARRYPPVAVAVFRKLRSNSRIGRPPRGPRPPRGSRVSKGREDSDLDRRLEALDASASALAAQLQDLLSPLRRTRRLTFSWLDDG